MKKAVLLSLLFAACSTPTVADSFSLPIWKEDAEALGYTLPKPIGFNLSYMTMEQGINVDSIDLQGLDFIQLNADPGKQYTEVLTLRADVWLLPFLNLYGLVGKLDGYSTTDVTLTAGFNPNRPIITHKIQDFRLDLDGYTTGFGAVLVGGYENWFALVDASFTQSRLTVIDGTIDAIVVSPRVGYDFNRHGTPLRIWAGAMYQDVEQTLRGSVSDLSPSSRGLPNLKFEVQQHLQTPWNPIVGMQYQINESWYLLGEFGFGDRQSMFFSVDRRF
ncbi:TonB-dependent receptor [Vibrio vulnificus]|uniref:TonB-dependent receptor n=1 Tax=Vibrio vulnificus TaxID=672 RepID=UPI0010296434|nr:TonB-dependent receptor [Vibrio vulnificus]EGQ9931628.1 TonB-dependent receptor [Vibrio vulnificus]ELI0611759.1 TonB-dependent receptor [Vibrio vulnificus]MCU8272054.1 TonB-dependent receptor [Vibrio vulnificus]RZQ10876.1 TonB-dependent receptor [Vibrio vulnificus]